MTSLISRLSLVLLILTVFCNASYAVNPDERLADPALEERARVLSKQLRCLVCQNQSIDDSDAELARDLRILVRERISIGETNDQALDFIVQRYGEFVLLKPRFAAHTLILWGLPIIMLLAGLWLAMSLFQRRKTFSQSEPDLQTHITDKEKKALEELQNI